LDSPWARLSRGLVLAAHDLTRIETINVSPRGLDLSRPADAQTFYTQLKNAAWVVCTRGIHVGLVPIDNPKVCIEGALGEATRSAKVPMLTQICSHTLEEAAAHGITLPSQVAAK
jgi:UrcA family protein